jgi:hypothetical protein
LSAPNNHFTTRPHGRVILTHFGCVGRAGSCPSVRRRIVPTAAVQLATVVSTPYDHFSASPHCRVRLPTRGRVIGAGGYPSVRAGIVFAAGVQIIKSPPDDHFTASPHCRVTESARRRVVGGRPGIIKTCAALRYFRKRVARARR